MRVLVVGAGLVGRELAARLTEQGHEVVATTTTEAKVEDLKQVAVDAFTGLASVYGVEPHSYDQIVALSK